MLYGIWERWKAFAHVVGNFQARFLLTIFYFIILSPFGLGVRLFADPSNLKQQGLSHWIPKPTDTVKLWERARQQS